ncbi:MAG: hydantoinase B/oxoprolinase family protein [Rhizobiaceae bacterium]|nr:hydantoinase B/oxoprolinase family protein [Rhizobiaceae bacterium]
MTPLQVRRTLDTSGGHPHPSEKAFFRDEINETVRQIILTNVRMPTHNRADMNVQIACVNIGEPKLLI